MSTATACPQPEHLSAFVQGRLDLHGHEAVEAHLDDCTACLHAVETFDNGSPLPGWNETAPIPAEDGLVKHLAERAKGLAFQQPVPAELGQYQLQDRLGVGGMGEVFRAEHRGMKRTVAVKLLSQDLFRSPAARARFQREVELAGRVDSPHVVAALDGGEADGRPFLVMEYVAGRDLSRLVKEDGPLPWRKALELLRQAALGLADAHDAGIVHRDVKPSNLLIDEKGTVKVADLGLARACLETNDKPSDLTGSQSVMGTAAFLAPEQAADTRKADARSDIYSLGCTLYFLMTGRPPFEGATVMEVVFAHREKAMPSLAQADPKCPVPLINLFKSMTARNPRNRPATMRAVVGDIDRVLAGPGKVIRRPLYWVVGVAAAWAVTAVGVWMAWPEIPDTSNAPPLDDTLPPPQGLFAIDMKGNITPAARPAWQVDNGFIQVKPGQFHMGSSDEDPQARLEEKPRHLVQITRSFWLAKYEVTQGEFFDLMGTNCSVFSTEGRGTPRATYGDRRKLPVESVPWLVALDYCNKLSLKNDLPPYYSIDKDKETVKVLGGPGFRLPTEAEWEYACRAGTDTRWSFGNDPDKLDEYAWSAKNADRSPHPVGQKKPNLWGFYDMHGNVPEWCWDRFDPNYYNRSVACDPSGSGEGTTRVYRGGSWNHVAKEMRSADRNSLGLGYGPLATIGFRVARDAD